MAGRFALGASSVGGTAQIATLVVAVAAGGTWYVASNQAPAPDNAPQISAEPEPVVASPDPDMPPNPPRQIVAGEAGQGGEPSIILPEGIDAVPSGPDMSGEEGVAPTGVLTETNPPAEGPLSSEEKTPPAELADEDPVIPPQFDIVRIDRDGTAIVAGQAAPAASVTVVLDGQPVTALQADRTGKFAALFSVPQSEAPQIMRLEMSLPGQNTVVSRQSVIVAPSLPVVAGETDGVPRIPGAPDGEPLATGEDVPPLILGQLRPNAGRPDPTPEEGTPSRVPPAGLAALDRDKELVSGTETAPPVASGEVEIPERDLGQVAEIELDVDLVPEPRAPDAGLSAPVETRPSVGSLAPGTAAFEADVAQQDPGDGAVPVIASGGSGAPAPDGAVPIVPEVNVPPGALGRAEPRLAPVATETDVTNVAPTVLLADGAGLRVLQNSAARPAPPQSVIIDTISYDSAGDVALRGRGTGTGFVRAYLNNRPIKTVEIQPDGQWRMPLPEVDTGVYTLRVDELNAAGEVTSRMETPFKREEPEIVATLDVQTAEESGDTSVITVQPGHSLWKISLEEYGRGEMYVQLYRANRSRIRNPDLIYPGQVFSLPNR